MSRDDGMADPGAGRATMALSVAVVARSATHGLLLVQYPAEPGLTPVLDPQGARAGRSPAERAAALLLDQTGLRATEAPEMVTLVSSGKASGFVLFVADVADGPVTVNGPRAARWVRTADTVEIAPAFAAPIAELVGKPAP